MTSNYIPVTVDKRKKPVLDAFVEKLQLNDNGCWLWQGAKIKGYGVMSVRWNGRKETVGAHRIAYELFIGDIPSNMTIDHGGHCKEPTCVNPNHLRLLTRSENSADNWPANLNRKKTHCPNGHPFNKENTQIRKLKNGRTGRGCRECARVAAYAYANKISVAEARLHPRQFRFRHKQPR